VVKKSYTVKNSNMKRTTILTFLLLCGAFSPLAFGQSCSAAFVDSKIVVNEYTPEGKCFLPSTATGMLTVQTADLSPTESIPTGKLPFQVAIRNKESNTLRLFAKRTYHEIDLEKVLAKCQKGDHLVLLMLEEGYALPHHEILIQ